MNNMPKTQDRNINQSKNPNYDIPDEERALSLSIAFCYSLRIADTKQRK